jgi:flagellar protein FlaG
MDIASIQNSLSPASAGPKAERGPAASAAAAEAAGAERQLTENSTAKQAAQAESTQQASREEVEAAVATIQDFVQSVRRSINFSLEEGSGRVVVKVTDAGSGDVIRQIPSEEALQLAENLSEVRSLLFKAEA